MFDLDHHELMVIIRAGSDVIALVDVTATHLEGRARAL
jgi:hypothetical protein